MFTREEIQVLAEGLDALARNSKDVIMVSMRLASLRGKLEELSRSLATVPIKNEATDEVESQ